MIKKSLTLLSSVMFLSLLLIVSCSEVSNPTQEGNSVVAISISFEENSEFASVARSAEAIVSAEDFDEMAFELEIGKEKVTGALKDIPAGKNRTVQVNVYNDKKEICYTGRTIVDVVAGQEVIASLNLYETDKTGTIIVNGTVITDNSNTEYFTEEELTEIATKMAKGADADVKKVLGLLERTLFARKWKKSQLPEVERIIGAAIREVLGNNDEYFTERELNAMVERLSKEEGVDPEEVQAVLKKGGKFYETKWKKTQEREVIALIKKAIDEVLGNNDEYFTDEELERLVVGMSERAGVDAEKVKGVLKEGKKFYETRWKKSQEREVIALIKEAIDEVLGNNDEYFTKEELEELVVGMSERAGADPEKVSEVLKKGGKFYETKWKKSQEREVVALIQDAIDEVLGNNNEDYFTADELEHLVIRLSEEAGVEVREVMGVLKKSGKFYTMRWKKDQEREVIALIEAAIEEIS